MVTFKDTRNRVGIVCGEGWKISCSLVVGVPNPREGAQSTHHDCNIGDHAHNQHGIVGNVEMAEIIDDFQK